MQMGMLTSKAELRDSVLPCQVSWGRLGWLFPVREMWESWLLDSLVA